MPALNLTRYCLEHAARDQPNITAFRFIHNDGRVEEWTFAEAFDRCETTARALLATGLARGERVLVRLPHSPDYAFAFFGAVLAGLVPVPVSPSLTPEEVQFLASDSGAAAIVTDGPDTVGVATVLGPEDLARQSPAMELPETDAEDPAFLIYTSGTTAKPKGVLHAQRTVLGRALMRESWQGFRAGDHVMHAGALNWSYTLGAGLMDPWAARATAHLGERPDDPGAWLERARAFDIDVFIAVPTVYRQALKYGDTSRGLPRLRHALSAGEPLPPALLDEWRAAYGVPMYESLGMTEISTYISCGPNTPVRPGSAGKAQPGRRIAILPVDSDSDVPLPTGEVGMLAVHRSDPGLMLGYWNRPAEEADVYRGDWFTGGDLASIDEDGYVWFQGRADDIIKSFGFRLSPVEIEAVLEAHPAVAEAAVVGHEVGPQKTLVSAFLVAAPGTTVDKAEIEAHAREHLAEYKRPHEYRLVETLPRTPNGKLQRRRLLD
jgi:acyl-coenzyme A synthetase/AMP-(fatty) acid ligase